MWIDAENGSVYTPRMEGGMPRVNIYDISRHAGVSIATVSRVLNNSPHVSEETRRKVMKVIDGCGYVPNAFARGLGLNTMKTIGLLCPDAADPYLRAHWLAWSMPSARSTTTVCSPARTAISRHADRASNY